MSIAPRTKRALREAMGRLLEGRPARTDGRLTKTNLWREAQVSRATMNRATEILTEWDNRVGQHPATADQQRHREQLAEARNALWVSRERCRRLQDQVDAAATVIMTFLAENAALRLRADRSAVVVPLQKRAPN